MTLEKEIYIKLKEYGSAFDDRKGSICYEDFKDLASDLAKIVKNRQEAIPSVGGIEKSVMEICNLAIPEIDKDKIAETKTLDKEEVGKILSNIPCLKMNLNLNLISDFMEFRDLAVDEICKLAIRKIDKEEIIAVIDFWVYELSRTYTDFDLIEPYDVNKLANEIVKKLEE